MRRTDETSLSCFLSLLTLERSFFGKSFLLAYISLALSIYMVPFCHSYFSLLHGTLRYVVHCLYLQYLSYVVALIFSHSILSFISLFLFLKYLSLECSVLALMSFNFSPCCTFLIRKLQIDGSPILNGTLSHIFLCCFAVPFFIESSYSMRTLFHLISRTSLQIRLPTLYSSSNIVIRLVTLYPN